MKQSPERRRRAALSDTLAVLVGIASVPAALRWGGVVWVYTALACWTAVYVIVARITGRT